MLKGGLVLIWELHMNLVPTLIDKFVEHSKTCNKPILIWADSNAHSQLWMSEIENQRGEILEDFITLNNLMVCNIGNRFTYDCAIGKSIIDITMASTLLVDRIKNSWKYSIRPHPSIWF